MRDPRNNTNAYRFLFVLFVECRNRHDTANGTPLR